MLKEILIGILLSITLTLILWIIYYYIFILPKIEANSADLYQWRSDQINLIDNPPPPPPPQWNW